MWRYIPVVMLVGNDFGGATVTYTQAPCNLETVPYPYSLTAIGLVKPSVNAKVGAKLSF